MLNPLITNSTKWSNTLKQFVGNLPTNCLSVFDHFVKLAFKRLNMFLLLNLSIHPINSDSKFKIFYYSFLIVIFQKQPPEVLFKKRCS